MTNISMTQVLIYVILALGVVAGWFYPIQQATQLAGSATGTTFSTAKIADINFAPTSASATSTSVLNTDSSTRWVKSVHYFCTGMKTNFFQFTAAGVLALNFTAATTSTANSNLVGVNTNYILATNVATSTDASALTASTTPGLTATQEYLKWPAGSYLTFQSNATSSTASCTIGVDYAAS